MLRVCIFTPILMIAVRIRAYWRLTRIALHLTYGLVIVAVLFPFVSTAVQRRIKQKWSRQLVGQLGIRIRQQGDIPPGPLLIVCNHISWLDIFIINAQTETHFVCKAEVRDWPIIGWLVEKTDTVFIARGNRAAAHRTAQSIVQRLRQSDRVALFPEGTTTNGLTLLPFKAALFQAAADTGTAVMPAALRYIGADGQTSRAPAYDGDITMLECMHAIAHADGLIADLRLGAALDAHLGRRALASLTHHQIAQSLGLTPLSDAPDLEDEPSIGEALAAAAEPSRLPRIA